MPAHLKRPDPKSLEKVSDRYRRMKAAHFDLEQAMRDAYENGNSIKAIQEETGYGYSTVYRILFEQPVSARRRSRSATV